MEENTKDNLYRYKDLSERYRKMNKLFIIAASSVWVLFVLYLLLKVGVKNINLAAAGLNIGLSLFFMIANILFYLRNRENAKLCVYVAAEVGIVVFLLGMMTDAEFVYFALLGVLLLLIPYYEWKMYRITCIVYILMFTVIIVVRNMNKVGTNDVDSLCQTIFIYLLLTLLYHIGKITKLFSDHALGSVEEQSGRQKVMLDGVLDISRTVQSETAKSGELVDALVHATESVAQSMKEISSAANTTARNIEEQNSMTQSIQSAIDETGERSKEMVGIATDSNESIQENMRVMAELKSQSEQIAETNREVTEAMSRLQSKTREVEEIAGMILNISSQTNLLALNASIESARAGEAGRGFAVVADQIRQLAEQTRSSTEEITRIINELNANADEVVDSVEHSVEATTSQNQKIIMAADSFERLNANMAQLIEGINRIDGQILGLSDSNNRIVENISHLSAATEEVTASAEQVREMSEQNLTYAEEVKGAMELVVNKTDDMKKYL